MCGIFGVFGTDYKQVEKYLVQTLSHRGPDDSGVYFDHSNKISIGHVRLSIIDLSNHAHQPMLSESDDYILSFNGEIYNYLEIKDELISLGINFKTHSDTEVLLQSFIYWGQECLHKLRGMFAFCIYDKLKNELFLARDRLGIKPLIYSVNAQNFAFSSELNPLVQSGLVSKTLSKDSISDYFQFGSIKQEKTIFQDAYHLLPGHFMRVNLEKKVSIERYYDYVKESEKVPPIDCYQVACKQIRKELEKATQYHMVGDVEVGAFLSGGIDSTAVVALMKQYTDSKITTFSLGFKHRTSIEDEAPIAARTAKALGCAHNSILIDGKYVNAIFEQFIEHLDQPSIDGINTFIVSYETSKLMKVALSGLGGDEIFAGYQHFAKIKRYTNARKHSIYTLLKYLNNIRPNRFTDKFKFSGLSIEDAVFKQRLINHSLNEVLSQSNVCVTPSDHPSLSHIQRISKSEIDEYMLNTLLRDNDVLSMAHSLEVRPVLLDHKLVEMAFSLPDDFKIRRASLKSVFVDSVKDIIPQEVWLRKKTGFEMPFAEWMNDCLNDRFREVLNLSLANELFVPEYLEKLKARVSNYKAQRQDWVPFIFLAWADKKQVSL